MPRGGPAYPGLLLFKMLLVGLWHGDLSDESVEDNVVWYRAEPGYRLHADKAYGNRKHREALKARGIKNGIQARR